MTSRPVDLFGSLLADVDALEDAACSGSGVEFVDVDQGDAEHLVRAYCLTCSVVLACRERGEAYAPHQFATVYGGRYWPKRATSSVPVLTRRTA